MNTSLLDSFLLNDESPTVAIVAADFDDLEYNGYSLQSTDVITQEMTIYSAPSRELVTYKVPRDDGSRLNGAYFRERRVKVKGIIQAASRVLLEREMDRFKRYMSQQEGMLYLKVDDEIRVVKATVANTGNMFDDRKGFHITYTPFSLEFAVLDPFLHDLEYSSVTNENETNLDLGVTVENLGTVYSRPVITVIVEAATSVTGFQFLNNTNGDSLTISESLSAGDILVIDSEESRVTLNGSEVDYAGRFPRLIYGSNNCSFVTTGSSVQFTSTISFKRSYL